MTVTYLEIVPTAGWSNTFRIFSYWRGSLFKGVWNKLLLYCLLYSVVSVTYRLVISTDEQTKQGFEKFCVFCNKYQGFMPLQFILGFYVSQVSLEIRKQMNM